MARSRFEQADVQERPERIGQSEARRPISLETRANLKVADAVQQAASDIGDHKNRKVYAYKIRGLAGERLAQEARPESVDTNEGISGNFPVYDLFDKENVMSVKTRANRPDGEPPHGNYAHDLRVAIGAIRPAAGGKYDGMRGVDIAADRLQAFRYDNPQDWKALKTHLPAELRQAKSSAEMATAMTENAQLLIPADHLQSTRDYIERVAQNNPELYGISPSQTEYQIGADAKALAQRVQPIIKGISSEKIDTYATRAAR